MTGEETEDLARELVNELSEAVRKVGDGLQSDTDASSLCDVVSQGLDSVANAITPQQACAAKDDTGGTVRSLTESVMGITAAIVQVARALESIADAIRKPEE